MHHVVTTGPVGIGKASMARLRPRAFARRRAVRGIICMENPDMYHQRMLAPVWFYTQITKYPHTGDTNLTIKAINLIARYDAKPPQEKASRSLI